MSVDLSKIQSQFRQAAQQGQEVSMAMERGQAEMPMAGRFEELLAEGRAAPFAFILLGLTIEARGEALGWMCGDDFRVLSVRVPQEVGLVEIHLQERGFTLEKSDGSRLEFAGLDPFLKALSSADLAREGDEKSWVDPLRLHVTSSKGTQCLRVLMPENVKAVLESPALMQRLALRRW